MRKVTGIKNALGIALCAVTFGCGTTIVRQVTSSRVLQSGNVDCHWRQVIWESSDNAHGCDVTVTYRGTETCPARLLTISPTHAGGFPKSEPLNLTPGQATEPAGPAGRTVNLRDVQTIWLACGEQNGERHRNGCSYTIDRINCSLKADELEITRLDVTSLTNVAVTCGTKMPRTVWEAAPGHKDTGCHVTVRLSSSAELCQAILEFTDAKGRERSMSTPSTGDILTLVNVTSIRLRCGQDTIGNEPCTCEVLQIDCPK